MELTIKCQQLDSCAAQHRVLHSRHPTTVLVGGADRSAVVLLCIKALPASISSISEGSPKVLFEAALGGV